MTQARRIPAILVAVLLVGAVVAFPAWAQTAAEDSAPYTDDDNDVLSDVEVDEPDTDVAAEEAEIDPVAVAEETSVLQRTGADAWFLASIGAIALAAGAGLLLRSRHNSIAS